MWRPGTTLLRSSFRFREGALGKPLVDAAILYHEGRYRIGEVETIDGKNCLYLSSSKMSPALQGQTQVHPNEKLSAMIPIETKLDSLLPLFCLTIEPPVANFAKG